MGMIYTSTVISVILLVFKVYVNVPRSWLVSIILYYVVYHILNIVFDFCTPKYAYIRNIHLTYLFKYRVHYSYITQSK